MSIWLFRAVNVSLKRTESVTPQRPFHRSVQRTYEGEDVVRGELDFKNAELQEDALKHTLHVDLDDDDH